MARPAFHTFSGRVTELQAVDEGAVPASAPATSRLFVLPVAARRWVSTDNNYAGFVSDTFVPDSGGFNLEDLDNFTSLSPAKQGDPDVLGSSQLGGAPLGYSQQQTPQPSLRPQRQMRSPDRHTYS